MKKLFIILLSAISLTAVAQETIALLEPRVGEGSTPVTAMEKNMVRGELRKAIVNFSGYDAITRADIDQIMNEHNFQRTGLVSDSQIKKLGEMFGADYICVSTLTKSDTEFYLEAYLIHVESGRMSNPASQYGELSNGKLANMFPACKSLAEELLGNNISKRSKSGATQKNSDYTEDAWGINMKMIWVEGGEFMMGCTSEQGSDCDDDEKNVRRVTVDGFFIGMLEVTQSQWEKVMGTSIYQQTTKAGGSEPYGVGPNHPINCVSWDEAMEFCRLLSNKTGKTYTLPTEAQWEYAAKGGKKADGTKYAGSNMIDAVAWYTNNSGSSTHPCGTKQANSLGIYDMSGNVWEWCKDWYSNSYANYDTNNPSGPSSGSYRVFRDGCWSSKAVGCRVTNRNYYSPHNRCCQLGFRVVCLP